MKKTLLVLASMTVAFSEELPASAQVTDIWAGGSGNWTTPSEWSAGAPPSANNQSALIESGSGTITIDPNRPFYGGIIFDQSAGAYTLTGGPFVTTYVGAISIASTFTGTGITETVNTPVTINAEFGVTNNSADAANTLYLGPSATLTGPSGSAYAELDLGGSNTGTNTIASVISGQYDFVDKNGTGTWILTGANTYTSETQIGSTTFGTYIDAGTLQVGNGGTMGNLGTGIIHDSGTLVYDRSDTIVETNSIIGTGKLIQAGSGTLVLTGTLAYPYTNSWSGGTVINAGGTIQVGNSSAGAFISQYGILDNGALDYYSYNGDDQNIISGTGSVSKTGLAYNLNFLNASSTYTGFTKIDVGILNVAGVANGGLASSIGASTNAAGNLIFGGGTLQFTGSTAQTTDRLLTIGDSGGSSATLDASGTNSGTLSFTNSGAIAFGVAAPSVLNLTGSNTGSNLFALAIGDSAVGDPTTLNKTGTGTWILTGSNTYSGLTTVSGGELDLNTTGAQAIGGSLTISGGTVKMLQSNEVNSGGNLVVSGGTFNLQGFNQTVANVQLTGGAISGTGGTLTSTHDYDIEAGTVSANLAGAVGLTKTTTGTATLTGTNTFSGTTAINAGVLNVSSTAGLGGTSAITFGGGTLQYGSPNFTDYSSLIVNSTGAISIDTNGQNVGFISPLAASNTGGLTKLGTGTLALFGANYYTGLTTVTGGELDIRPTLGPYPGFSFGGDLLVNGGTARLFASGLLNSSANLSVSSGTFDLQNFNQSMATVHLTGGTIAGTVGTLTSATTFDLESGTASASLVGAVGVTKTTSGTVTLSGANSFTGLTAINGGVLNLGSAQALADTSGLTFGGGTLQYSAFNQTDYSLEIKNSTGAISIDTNGQNVSFGTLASSNTGGLTKLGSGTLSLYGLQGYTGLTTVSGGELDLNSQLNGVLLVNGGTAKLSSLTFLGNSATFTVSSGTLDVQGTNQYIAGLQLKGGTITGAGGEITSSTDYDLEAGTVSTNLNGNVSLIKTTSGTVTLSGSNTYTGFTEINGGTLSLGSSNALAFSHNISFGGGTLQFTAANTTDYSNYIGTTTSTGAVSIDTNGQSVTFASPLGSGLTGGLTKLGSGTLTLSAAEFYSGSTLVSAGTLEETQENFSFNASNLTVNSGATFALGVGGTLGFTASDVGSISSLGTATTGFKSGSILGLDTTNATGGTFVYANNLINPNGQANALGLAKLGTGTLVMSGFNQYTGATLDTKGTLEFANEFSLYSHTTSQWTASNIVVSNGAVLALAVGGSNQFTTTDLGILLGLGTTTGGFESGSSIGFDTSNAAGGNFTYSSIIANTNSGANSLGVVKLGTNKLTLAAPNSYTGPTTIANGSISIVSLAPVNTAQPLGRSSSLILAGATSATAGTLVYTGVTATMAQNVTVTTGDFGAIDNAGTGILTLSGTIAKNGSVLTLEGGKFVVTGTITGASANSDLDIGNSSVTGTTIVGLTTANSYNGPTVITNGSTLLTGINNALPFPALSAVTLGSSTDTVAKTNTLDLLGHNESVSSLTAAGPGTNQIISSNGSAATPVVGTGNSATTATLAVNYSGATVDTYSGSLGGSGSSTNLALSKLGTGTLALTNASGNNYAGGTTVSAGGLLISNTSGSATGSGAVAVSGSTTVLKGRGEIDGAVTLSAGATLYSGNTATGTGSGMKLTSALSVQSSALTFLLANGTTSATLSNPNTTTSFLNLGSTGTISFSGTDTINLVDLTSGGLTLRMNAPYLLTSANSDSMFTGLVVMSSNGVIGLSQNNVNGLVLGVYTGGDGTTTPYTYSTIALNELSADGSTALAHATTADPGYYQPSLYLENGDLEVVPEPGTWALMLGGFALLMAVQRRRQTRVSL